MGFMRGFRRAGGAAVRGRFSMRGLQRRAEMLKKLVVIMLNARAAVIDVQKESKIAFITNVNGNIPHYVTRSTL
jgi:hypothetical protein